MPVECEGSFAGAAADVDGYLGFVDAVRLRLVHVVDFLGGKRAGRLF